MKYISWLRLLSVLLLTVTLFVGCAPQTGNGTGTGETTAATTEEVLVNDEKKHEPVDAKLENFFQLSKENAWKLLSTVTRLGERTKNLGKQVVSSGAEGNLLILREADVDHMNVVTEVFTIYNVELKKTVLTVQNQYENGIYSTFNWDNPFVTDEKIKYPESEMDVWIDQVCPAYNGNEAIYVIKVGKATVTPIDEEIRKENEYACVYDIKTSYDYYDVTGKLITSTTHENWEMVRSNGQTVNPSSYRIGDTFVTFDQATGESVYISNLNTDKIRAAYDGENEKYGYFFNQTMTGALNSQIPFVEVFSKTSGNCIRRHYVKDAMSANVFVLEDGDVLIQTFSLYFDDSETNEKPDFFLMGVPVTVDHYILDVETGAEQAFALDYVILDLIPCNSVRFEELEDWGPTEHAVNVAVIAKYDNYTVTEEKALVLDNDGTVMYTFDQMVPEHMIQYDPLDLGVYLLDNGEYLVNLQGTVADRAIVTKDGKVRSYLPSGAEVVGELVVMEDGIYDYDLNRLYTFEDEGYSLEYVIGGRIIASSPYEDEEAGDSIAYYVMNRTDAGFDPQRVLVDCELLADQSSEDYVMAYNFKTNKYVLYNAELRHLLTTANPMKVYEFDGNYLVHTTLIVEEKMVDLIYTVE